MPDMYMVPFRFVPLNPFLFKIVKSYLDVIEPARFYPCCRVHSEETKRKVSVHEVDNVGLVSEHFLTVRNVIVASSVIERYIQTSGQQTPCTRDENMNLNLSSCVAESD